jgi:pimeloyl-ACP methyl ester carboxylesterase
MPQTDGTANVAGRYVAANGLEIYYEDYGSGQPLVLLHGGTVTAQMWEPLLPALVPHFRVITPDSRAHGRTLNPTGELSYALMADDVAAFIQALGLTKPLVFGYSDGGQIALELGMRYPGLAAALVVGAAWYRFSDMYVEFLTAAGFPSAGEVDVAHIQQASPEWVAELTADHARADDPDYWQTLLRQISRMWWTPLDYPAEAFQQMTDPTLILLGDRDGIIDLEQAVEMYHALPNAELAILPNATHLTALTEASLGLVVEFLLRHRPGDEVR